MNKSVIIERLGAYDAIYTWPVADLQLCQILYEFAISTELLIFFIGV